MELARQDDYDYIVDERDRPGASGPRERIEPIIADERARHPDRRVVV